MRNKRIENIAYSPGLKIKNNQHTHTHKRINSMNRLQAKTQRYKKQTQNTNHQKIEFQFKVFPNQLNKQPSKCPSFIIELQKRKGKDHPRTINTIVSNNVTPVIGITHSSKNCQKKDIFYFKANSIQKKRLVQNFEASLSPLIQKKFSVQKNDNLQTSEILQVLTIESSQKDRQRKNDTFLIQNKLCPHMLVKKYGKSASQKSIKIKKKMSKLCIDNFKIIKKIGKGSYGDVYLVQQINTKVLYALKKIDKIKLQSPNEKQQAIRQIKIQSYLQSQVVASLYGWFGDQAYLYLVMEYFQTGSLSDLLRRKGKLAEVQAIKYLKQLCKAIHLIHSENIIHRDLKAENIFLHNITAKIGDFGCSVHTNELRQSIVGCYACLSPEQLQAQKYDQKVDIWSIGIICFEMLMGFSPFQNQLPDIINRKKSPNDLKLKFPQTCKISLSAKNFIKKCLALNPLDRPSASELLQDVFLNKLKEKTKIELSS